MTTITADSKRLITVQEAKKTGLIPEPWHEAIPDKCACNAENLITYNRKRVTCSDVRCRFKVADRMYNMLQKMGIKGMGPEFCKEYVMNNNTKTHIEILTCDRNRFPVSGSTDWYIEKIREARSVPRTFGEVVQLLSLPHMGSTSLAVFKGYGSWNAAVEKMNTYSDKSLCDFNFVCSQIGHGETAGNVTETLRSFVFEMQHVGALFNVIAEAKKVYKVAITGSLAVGVSREVFPQYVREKTDNAVTVQISKAFASVDFVIADSPSGSRTYQEGQARGKLITSGQFMEMVMKGVS